MCKSTVDYTEITEIADDSNEAFRDYNPYIYLYEEHQNMCTDTFIHNRAHTSVNSTSKVLNRKQLQLRNTTQDGRHTYIYSGLRQCKLK